MARLRVWQPTETRFYGGGNFALLVCDVSNKNSFLHLDDWITDLKKSVDKLIPMVILVNKCDLANQQITTQMIQSKAYELKCPFLLTSAKTVRTFMMHFSIALINISKISNLF